MVTSESVETMRTLAEQVIPVAGILERKTPVAEFLLFGYGSTPTSYGPVHLTPESALECMRRYEEDTRNRDGYLDIDVAHLSQTDSPDPSAHLSVGKFRLDLRDDGIWVTGLEYTSEMFEAISDQRIKYYSPVILTTAKNEIIRIAQLAVTNFPAMKTARPLALSEKQEIKMPETSEIVSSDKALKPQLRGDLQTALVLQQSGISDERKIQLEDRGVLAVVDAIRRAVSDTLGYNAHIEDIFPDYVIIGMDPRGSELYEVYKQIPYRLETNRVVLGMPVEVRKSWTPVAEMEAMLSAKSRSEELNTLLLTATGKTALSSAIAEIDRLKSLELDHKKLSARALELEVKAFEAEKSVILSEAKKAGTWTNKLEALALKAATNARKLSEDPAQAMREVFEAAPVVISPVQEAPQKIELSDHSAGRLNADELESCETLSRQMGIALETVKTQFLSDRRRLLAR